MIIFKNEKDKKLFCSLHPILIMIFADAYVYMQEKYQINLVVTETVTTKEIDDKYNRKSPAHRQARAIDVRSRNLTKNQIDDLLEYLNNNWRYKRYRYMSKSGVKRIAYHHNNGNGEHIHIAIHARYSLDI